MPNSASLWLCPNESIIPHLGMKCNHFLYLYETKMLHEVQQAGRPLYLHGQIGFSMFKKIRLSEKPPKADFYSYHCSLYRYK